MASQIEGHEKLSIQLLSRVLSFLNICDRDSASLVCKTWYKAAQDPEFLKSTCIRLLSEDCDQATLRSISKRNIPSLKIFHVPEICPKVVREGCEFVSNVTFLHLSSALNTLFTARNVIYCLKRFKNLQTLRIDPHYHLLFDFFGDNPGRCRKALTKALTGLPNLELGIPTQRYNPFFLGMLPCFSGVGTLRLTSEEPSARFTSSCLESCDEREIYGYLTTPGIVTKLQDLDLRWCRIGHGYFQDLVNLPGLRPRTLRFSSWDGEGCNLQSLADSDLSPEILEVICQESDTADIRYQGISELLSKKPSVKRFDCVGMRYLSTEENGHNPARVVAAEWPNMDRIDVLDVTPNTDSWRRDEVRVSFQVENNLRKLVLSRLPSHLDNETMLLLAQKSPALKSLDVCPGKRHPDKISPVRMSTIVGSFPELTQLTLKDCDLSGVDLGPSGPSPLNSLTKLESLHLGYCRGVTEDDIVGLSLPRLKSLKLTNCGDVTDRAVISVASANSAIRLLCLDGCTKITDKSVAAIAGHLKHLRRLSLIDCDRILGGSATTLSDGCPMLQRVDVTGCGESFVRWLKRLRPSFPYLGSVETDTGEWLRKLREKLDMVGSDDECRNYGGME